MMESKQEYTITEQGLYKISVKFNKDGQLSHSEITVKGDDIEQIRERFESCEEFIASRIR